MAFDEIAGISAAEESVRLGIDEAQAEAKRIVAQAELAGKTDVEQARDKAAKELAARRAEAQAEAVLGEMGIADVTAVCGAQMLTLIVPEGEAGGETDRAKILSAASGQTGIPAESVKIILVKNGAEDCADGENLVY